MGFHIFPLRARSKVPATPNGLKDASEELSSEDLLASGYNVGVRTGPESGVWVLDVDAKNGGLDSLQELQNSFGRLTTAVVRTGGGGYHYYYKWDERVRNRAGVLPGIDVRGANGYVVAAGSTHENGVEYVYQGGEIEVAPDWLLELVLPSAPSDVTRSAGVLVDGERGELSKATLRFCLEGALPGTWHHQLVKACLDLKQQGYTYGEAIAKLESGPITLDETHDVPTVRDIYENREVKHPPRLPHDDGIYAVDEGGPNPPTSLVIRAVDLAGPMMAYITDKDKVKGEPTGLPGLDHLLGGGRRRGELTAYCAEAKTGKNTLWHYLMFQMLGRGVPLGYASRELSPENEVLPNILSIVYGENAWLADITPERTEKYKTALSNLPLYFARGYGYFPIEDIKRWIGELREVGVTNFFVDHLHYCLEDSEEFKEAAKFARELKALTKTEDIHIDLIVQPTKIAEGQKLGLNAMRGGAAIGQAIDNLFILERVKREGVRNVTKLTLDVARSKLCNPGHIYLQYDPATMCFDEAAGFDETPVDPAPPSPGNSYAREFNDRRIG